MQWKYSTLYTTITDENISGGNTNATISPKEIAENISTAMFTSQLLVGAV